MPAHMLSMKGSSPLTRGKLSTFILAVWDNGLIPAHAGKTPGAGSRMRACRAHPRSRGENSELRACLRRVRGSSPLTRGKRNGRDGGSRRTGLIPAHAGKTFVPVPSIVGSEAHPRSRGENVGGDPQELPDLGSSPLTRGKQEHVRGFHAVPGLIPAHAGKTRVCPRRRRPCRAHPRSRGEN